MTNGRLLVIGDIHGMYDELMLLFNSSGFDPATDTLVALGDYIDRGPQSRSVIEFIMDLKARHGSRVTLLRGAPSKQGRECLEYPFDAAYDREFVHGFTTMMGTFIRALQQSSCDTGVSLDTIIGLDVRSLLQLGSFSFSYMLVGPHVVCLKTVVSEQDPSWTILKSTGISEVFHLPSIAAVMRSSAGTN